MSLFLVLAAMNIIIRAPSTACPGPPVHMAGHEAYCQWQDWPTSQFPLTSGLRLNHCACLPCEMEHCISKCLPKTLPALHHQSFFAEGCSFPRRAAIQQPCPLSFALVKLQRGNILRQTYDVCRTLPSNISMAMMCCGCGWPQSVELPSLQILPTTATGGLRGALLELLTMAQVKAI